MKPGPPPLCNCGECRRCKVGAARRRHYQRNREAIIRKNVAAKAEARRLVRESVRQVSDEEMDRRAMTM